MANIYYKTFGNNYQKITYGDIDAAAVSHNHSIDDFYGWNFKDNGCTGQNVFINSNNITNNLLLYVPHTNSDIIYTKPIPAGSTVHYNRNKSFTQTIEGSNDTTSFTSITPSRTTAYQYNGLGKIILKNDTLDTIHNDYFYYTYPLMVQPTENNQIITLKFKVSIDNITWTIKFTGTTINDITHDLLSSNNDYQPNYYIGLTENNSRISGICIVKQQPKNIKEVEQIIDKQQIEITNITVNSQNALTVSQNYIDYYDYETIPSIKSTGSLGPIDSSKYENTINTYNISNETDVINYYRSYKFKNLLTFGQTFTISSYVIIPGYCDRKTLNAGFFQLEIPYELNTTDISKITLKLYQNNSQCSIWGVGGYISHNNGTTNDFVCNNKYLTAGTTIPSINTDTINYSIYRILSPGTIQFHLWFPACNRYINTFGLLKFVCNNGLQIQVSNN